MPPKVYGVEHLTFLAIFITLTVVSLVLFKKYIKNEKKQDIIVRIFGALTIIFVMWNRISLSVVSGNYVKLIPSSFCGMDSLVIGLAVFGKRNNNVLHFVVHLTFVGGLGTILYPTFLGDYDTFFHTVTLSGILHHAFSLYLTLLLYLFSWFRADYRKWPNMVIGFMAYITVGSFLIHVLGVRTAFYINDPILKGTPLTVWVLMPIFAVGYAIFMLIVELIRKHKKTPEEKNFEKIMNILKNK